MGKVFITGGTGFIGSHIAEYFIMKNEEVVCLARESGNTTFLEKIGAQIRIGDITDIPSLTSAMEGCACVIHAAARACDWGKYEDFDRVNVEGTLNVLKASVRNGIRQCLLTGSISVYGEENSDTIKNEASPFKSHYKYFCDGLLASAMNHYRDSKSEGTQKAIKYSKEHGIDLAILEPVWVYGEREFNSGFYEYMKTAQSGVPFMPGTKNNNFHVIYAGDVARAFFLTYEKQLKGINRFIIGNSKVDKMDRIFSLFCKEAEIRKPRSLFKWLIYPIGFALEFLYTFFRSSQPPVLTRGRVNMFYDSIQYSTDKARESLDFENIHTLEQGIKKTVAWYKANGYI